MFFISTSPEAFGLQHTFRHKICTETTPFYIPTVIIQFILHFVSLVVLVWNRHMTGHWHFGNPSTMDLLLQHWRVVFDNLLARSPNLSSCRLGQLTFHYRTYQQLLDHESRQQEH